MNAEIYVGTRVREEVLPRVRGEILPPAIREWYQTTWNSVAAPVKELMTNIQQYRQAPWELKSQLHDVHERFHDNRNSLSGTTGAERDTLYQASSDLSRQAERLMNIQDAQAIKGIRGFLKLFQ